MTKKKRLGKAIAFTNHKGGAGKTTSSDGFIYAAAKLGYTVLGIDADGQRNLSYSLGFDKQSENFYNLLTDEDAVLPVESQIKSTAYKNIDLIVADTAMTQIEMELTNRLFGRDVIVRNIVENIRSLNRYDFIVFDTNPSLALMNYNVLNAVDYAIIPVECSGYGLEGVEHIVKYIERVQKTNPTLKIAGVLRTRAETNTEVFKTASEILDSLFGDLVMETVIEKDVGVGKAQFIRVPIVDFGTNKRSGKITTKSARQLIEMTEEVLRNVL